METRMTVEPVISQCLNCWCRRPLCRRVLLMFWESLESVLLRAWLMLRGLWWSFHARSVTEHSTSRSSSTDIWSCTPRRLMPRPCCSPLQSWRWSLNQEQARPEVQATEELRETISLHLKEREWLVLSVFQSEDSNQEQPCNDTSRTSTSLESFHAEVVARCSHRRTNRVHIIQETANKDIYNLCKHNFISSHVSSFSIFVMLITRWFCTSSPHIFYYLSESLRSQHSLTFLPQWRHWHVSCAMFQSGARKETLQNLKIIFVKNTGSGY